MSNPEKKKDYQRIIDKDISFWRMDIKYQIMSKAGYNHSKKK